MICLLEIEYVYLFFLKNTTVISKLGKGHSWTKLLILKILFNIFIEFRSTSTKNILWKMDQVPLY